MIDQSVSEARLIIENQRDGILSGNVRGGDDNELVPGNPRWTFDAGDPAARNLTPHGSAMDYSREGEVVNIGAPIVTIVDLSDTWARAAIPETYADHIGYGDVLRVRLPGGTITSGKVFFKGVEGDYATQRDVSRRKRDIKTIVLKVRLDNPKGAYVPGMTAEVLVSPDQINTGSPQNVKAAERQ